MKTRTIARVLFTAICSAVLTLPVFAAGEQTTTIPVTLTVINTIKNIDVTMPAAMPVSVLDGKVLTADNVEITNNSDTTDVEVVSVSVENGAYTVASYAAFPEGKGMIAMRINGCETTGPGYLDVSKQAFPNVLAGTSQPINYMAKVSYSENVSGLKAANVIFTLRAVSES